MNIPDFIDRCLYLRFQIDTNRINSRQQLPAINRLEHWDRDGLIELFISEVAYEEALVGADPLRRQKTTAHYYSETTISTAEELRRLNQIERAIFPQSTRSTNEKNDVEIVFNADKYHAVLVTNDGASRSQPGGILGNRDRLEAIGIRVMTGDEAVALVEEHIRLRDDLIRQGCKLFKVPLPPWVGQD